MYETDMGKFLETTSTATVSRTAWSPRKRRHVLRVPKDYTLVPVEWTSGPEFWAESEKGNITSVKANKGGHVHPLRLLLDGVTFLFKLFT